MLMLVIPLTLSEGKAVQQKEALSLLSSRTPFRTSSRRYGHDKDGDMFLPALLSMDACTCT